MADHALTSLWAASAAVPQFRAPEQTGALQCELVVIGGGFTGLSTALHAAELGCDVIVLEAEDTGFGASGRNGGQVNPGVKLDEIALAARFGQAGRVLYQLGQEAPDFLADLIARKGLKGRFERNGLFRLAHNRVALGTVRNAAEALRRSGVAAEDLNAEAVRSRVGTARYVGGLYDPRGASVHPLDLVNELARAAAGAGARIFAHSAATSLRRERGRWRVGTAKGSVLARKILVATNAYTGGPIPELAESVLPVNSFQIATAPLGELGTKMLPACETCYDSRRLILYFRKSPDGRLVMGGRASFSSARDTSSKVADYFVLERVLHGVFPAVKSLPIVYRWTGLVGITFDYLPHYHALADELHILIGYNGREVALSHRLGAWLGRKLAGRPEVVSIPAVPIKPFPFHAWRETVLDLGMRWNRLMDVVGR